MFSTCASLARADENVICCPVRVKQNVYSKDFASESIICVTECGERCRSGGRKITAEGQYFVFPSCSDQRNRPASNTNTYRKHAQTRRKVIFNRFNLRIKPLRGQRIVTETYLMMFPFLERPIHNERDEPRIDSVCMIPFSGIPQIEDER